MEETTINGIAVTRQEALVWHALSSGDDVPTLATLTALSEYATVMVLSGLLARGMIQRCGDHEHMRFFMQ